MLRVHSIESMGTHDGPGLRMVVFLQGCKLRCVYCHNPDTWDTHTGQEMTVDALFEKAIHLKPYFGKRGGVTVSGGEPLLQSEGLIPFFKKLKAAGIHTNVDTNGRVLNHFTEELLDTYTDLVMLDIKHMTETGYQEITGLPHKETTFRFAAHREASGKPMWLRYVLIPGLTDTPELLHRLGSYFETYKTIERLELLPYHTLGVHKWEALGKSYPLAGQREHTKQEIEQARSLLEPYFKEVKVH
ncbi:pyruvate formate-lyase 1-activating enzyme [Sediminicola luteus]|uniref:Pyruvate formate-lyase-activating enzyme n=1 Tax=Sediminicola luteus TaxID=319238 RepID=A0A2A4GA37_9FLAO|nr:pyruvate formate-lyase 1-activating enzyme [Sediminicola luteus]